VKAKACSPQMERRTHDKKKRMIGPAFSSVNLRGFLEIFQENTEKLVQVIK